MAFVSTAVVHGPQVNLWLPKSVIGAMFGGSLGALTHGFRYCVRPKLQSCFQCYLYKAVSGAAMFLVLGAIMGLSDFRHATFFAFLGALVACVAAVITNVFHEPT